MANSFSVNIKRNAYGDIQRLGSLPNGRVLYSITDSEGNKAGKITIPEEQADTFEASYKEILETAPKIQEYVAINSSDNDIKKRRNIVRGIVAASGITGAAIPFIILRNSASVTKKILGTLAGMVTGLAAGFIASMGVTTPPGSLEFAKANRNLASLDIKPVLDEKV